MKFLNSMGCGYNWFTNQDKNTVLFYYLRRQSGVLNRKAIFYPFFCQKMHSQLVQLFQFYPLKEGGFSARPSITIIVSSHLCTSATGFWRRV
ncbi:hypothetical protein [Parapedobacter sp. DT-150]|uniref:hypothetical protein n=1 Tax=Parapedobacter sp. DT-150 TaxID=3396162 RepID=UPI003F194E39